MHVVTRYLRAALVGFSLLLAACTATVPPPGTVGYSPPQYFLTPGDRLAITVFGEEALSKEYVVSSVGDISFPLLGDVVTTGKTAAGLRDELAAKLSQGYLNDPRVTIEVLNYRPFYVLGEVTKPGEYRFSNDLTVHQAAALAGGFTYRADQRRVFIRHAGSNEERTYELTSDRPVYVAPGDTIRVGERYF